MLGLDLGRPDWPQSGRELGGWSLMRGRRVTEIIWAGKACGRLCGQPGMAGGAEGGAEEDEVSGR